MKLLKRTDGKFFLNNWDSINVGVIAGVDFNYKESFSSDFTVIITGLVDPFGMVYVVDMFRKRINVSDLPGYFFSYMDKWGWDDVGIDANANQIVMKPFLESWHNRPWGDLFPAESARVNKKIVVPRLTALESHGLSKTTLIESVCSSEWRNIVFAENLPYLDELKSEMENIRNTAHDDIGDAITNMLRVKYIPQILDVKRVDPETGAIRKLNQSISELIEDMDEFERMMAT